MSTSSSQQSEEQNHHGGPLSWWLRLTAPAGARQYELASTRQERDRLRRAGLNSVIAPFVFFAPLLLLQQSPDIRGFTVLASMMAASLVALFLNRIGHQVTAALFLVLSMDAVIEGSLLTAQGGLGSGWLLTFDLFVIPLIASGVLLSRQFLWPFLVLHIGLILGDFYVLPHTQDLKDLIILWHGPAIAFARPILIQLGTTLLTFAALRSMDQAIRRADRAEEIARLQQKIAEEKEQLERGIQEILQIVNDGANGRLATRSTMPQNHVLWTIASALNTLFARLQHSKTAEVSLRQAEHEVQRLIMALRSWRAGQKSVSWPTPSGTILDPLITEIRQQVKVPSASDAPKDERQGKSPLSK